MSEAAIIDSLLLGVVQGLTELLPVSSSGHLIHAHEWLGQGSNTGDLTFDALLHFATAAAILLYFWRDMWKLIKATVALPKAVMEKSPLSADGEMALALMVGTVPAVVLGLLLEDIMATLFRNPLLVAGTLVFGSGIMLFAERHQGSLMHLIPSNAGFLRGLGIGLFQSLALVPGMSRSGMAISGGMLFGMKRDAAAVFGFLLGVPLLLGAGAKKAFELGIAELNAPIFVGTAAAFIVALLVIHFLLRFLRTNTLHVFIWYRVALAFGIVFVLLL